MTGVGGVLTIALMILGCGVLTVREIKRRRMRKSHKVYVEERKAKDDAEREAVRDNLMFEWIASARFRFFNDTVLWPLRSLMLTVLRARSVSGSSGRPRSTS